MSLYLWLGFDFPFVINNSELGIRTSSITGAFPPPQRKLRVGDVRCWWKEVLIIAPFPYETC